MSKRARAQQILENPLLRELLDDYQALQFSRFKQPTVPDYALQNIYRDARAADVLYRYIQEKCKELIDAADDWER